MIQDMKKNLVGCCRQVARQYGRCRVQTSGVGPDLRYVSDSFSAHRADLTRRLKDESDPYYLGDADDDVLEAELEDRDYYTADNVFWVHEAARWEALRAAAKQPDIGRRTAVVPRRLGKAGRRIV